MRKVLTSLISTALCAVVLWQWGQAGWIFAKAHLAQHLIAHAWQQSIEQGAPKKPWQWADTWPVARLQAPEQQVDLWVLEGAQGHSLAFGPGRSVASALPGLGTSVIGGHRDTHFRFLKDTQVGDALSVQTPQGQWLNYRIREKRIVNSELAPLAPVLNVDQLILVTCYPFDTLTAAGPWRLLVYAEPADNLRRDYAYHSDQNTPPAIVF